MKVEVYTVFEATNSWTICQFCSASLICHDFLYLTGSSVLLLVRQLAVCMHGCKAERYNTLFPLTMHTLVLIIIYNTSY